MAAIDMTAEQWEALRDQLMAPFPATQPFDDEWQEAVASLPASEAITIVATPPTVEEGAEDLVSAVHADWLSIVSSRWGWAPTSITSTSPSTGSSRSGTRSRNSLIGM